MAAKETKDLVRFVVALGNGFSRAYADRVIGLGDVVYLLEALQKGGAAAEGITGCVAELKALSDADRAELRLEVTQLDLQSDLVEAVAEKALGATLALAEFVVSLAPKAA